MPPSQQFLDYMSSGWAEPDRTPPAAHEVAPYAAVRRQRLSARHVGERIVVPAGDATVRSNDTDYPYRPSSDFTWLTGWGSAAVPGAVLVMEPSGDSHEATLYFRGPAGRGTREFFADPSVGEFWVGARPGLAQVSALLDLPTRDLADLPSWAADAAPSREVVVDISSLRLIKDPYELAELRAAVTATHHAMDDVIRAFPGIRGTRRGERAVEGIFNTRSRIEGNGVGYFTISAAGEHACTLHYTDNTGALEPGELLLLDAGVEQDSLYTADVTRTLPIDGGFTPEQRMVYDAVYEANEAAFAVAEIGAPYIEMHLAAMQVIAEKTADWGLLPVSKQESLKPEHQFHRRYMVHGTGHMLGLDVHDGADAPRTLYPDGVLEEGMVFTIEPGLYFQADDLTVPPELRGIGVRIEDDVVMTEHGWENLSANIPRTSTDVQAWVRG